MTRTKILAKIPAIIIITIGIAAAIIIHSNTRGIPAVLYKKNSVDSLRLRYHNQTATIIDSNTINRLTSLLKSSQRFKGDRTNLNKDLIEVNYYLNSGNKEQMLVIDNTVHGGLLVFGWIHYKNDDFIDNIKKTLNQNINK
jgi:hypothetical protein